MNPFLANLLAPMPIHKKLYLVLRNTMIKVTKRQTCCGHAGEPGC